MVQLADKLFSMVTNKQLDAAREHYYAAEEKAAETQAEALAALADELPEKVEAAAKSLMAIELPTSRALGIGGVKQLRKQLDLMTERIAFELRHASDKIQWPTSLYAPPGVNLSARAVFDWLAPKTREYRRLFEQAGFTNAYFTDFEPKNLLDEYHLDVIQGQVMELNRCRQILEETTNAHQQAQIDELWEATTPDAS